MTHAERNKIVAEYRDLIERLTATEARVAKLERQREAASVVGVTDTTEARDYESAMFSFKVEGVQQQRTALPTLLDSEQPFSITFVPAEGTS